MEFHVRFAGAKPDLQAFETRLLALDPAALVDLDATSAQLRVSTVAQVQELADALAAAGHPVALRDIEAQPSVCCGGCSG